ncbi:MAG: hypothetical protein AAF685_09815 [Cyanobacteria bacterium P01_C01_bin.89]
MENLEFSVENCGKPVENLWKFCLGKEFQWRSVGAIATDPLG